MAKHLLLLAFCLLGGGVPSNVFAQVVQQQQPQPQVQPQQQVQQQAELQASPTVGPEAQLTATQMPVFESTTVKPGLEIVDPYMIMLDYVWAIFNIILAGVIGCYVASRPSDGIDRGFLSILTMLHGVEGTAFMIQAINRTLVRHGGGSAWALVLFLVLEISFHTPCLWSRFLYMYDCDSAKNMTQTYMHIVPFTAGTAISLFFWGATMVQSVRMFWMMIAFEMPGILGLCAFAGLWYASCSPNCRAQAFSGVALLQLVFGLFSFGIHLLRFIPESAIADAGYVPATFFTVRLFFEMLGFLANAGISASLSEMGVFTEAGTMNSAWIRPGDARIPVPLEERGSDQSWPRRFAFSSDRIFSCGFFFSIAAYTITFICLRFFTPEYNRQRDPIFRMYETLHPCILLDYLPGTLFAQPLYDAQIVLISFGMQICLIKKSLEGGFLRLAVGAFSYTVFLITAGFFQLVFTFNPTQVSVLMHSLPFMVFQIGIGSFVYSEMWSLYLNEKIGLGGLFIKYPAFMIYACMLITANFGAVVFMSGKLTDDPKLAMNKVDLHTFDQDPLIAESRMDMIKMAMSTFMAAAQEPLYALWFWLSPRKHAAVCCTVSLTCRSSEAQAAVEAESIARDEVATHGPASLNFNLRISSLFRMAMIILTVTLLIGSHVNAEHNHGQEGFELDWRASRRTLPGAAFMAVGWVIMLMFLTSYCVLEVYVTWVSGIPTGPKLLMTLASAFLTFTGFLAHGGTIPKVKYFYPGPELFVFGMLFYIAAKTVRTCAEADGRRKPVHVVCHLLSTLLVVFAVTTLIGTNSLIAELWMVVTVTVWSYLDMDDFVAVFATFEQVPDLGSSFPWPFFWELPYEPQATEFGPNMAQPSQFGKTIQSPTKMNSVSPTRSVGSPTRSVGSPTQNGSPMRSYNAPRNGSFHSGAW